MKKIPIALQLYTVRDEMEKDFMGTLEKVAEMGYDGVEFAGYGNFTAEQIRKKLEGLGLVAVSSHVGFASLESDIDSVVKFNKELGCKYIVISSLPKEKRPGTPGFESAITSINKFGKICKDNGLQLCYHNHASEFIQIDGKYGLDIIYEKTDPNYFQAQIDVYWVQYAGVDPAAYIRKYPGRCPMIHLKDMEEGPAKAFAEVGNGILDLKEIFAASEEVGVQWYIVEQDTCKRPTLESVKISIDNLRKMGL